MSPRFRLLALTVAAALWLFGSTRTARAHAWLGECVVDFDNTFALTWVLAQARATFAVPTGMSPSGDLEACDPTRHIACWTYRHRCFRNYINVAPMNYGHFHLSFEDPSLTCFADPGDGYGAGFGTPSGGGCVAADWRHEDRILQSHTQDHWIKIWLEDRVTHTPRVFDIPYIWVAGDKPIKFYFKKTDGSWWVWNKLDPGFIWFLGNWAFNVMEVRIRGSGEGLQAYTIGSFVIRD